MDYKYINQLLERYWKGETTLEEEEILRAFFSQKDVPVELQPYQTLFCYMQDETKKDVLGEDFDEKVLSKTEGPRTVKARVITMHQRLMPLFKAAAIVAILLTLGNAAQVPFREADKPAANTTGLKSVKGASVAMGLDTAVIDSVQQSNVVPTSPTPAGTILK
ncbi:MAG: pyruvate ferredoxin oxidoreductase [Prevotella sp.]|jgi:hypothetical protein|uniref:Pyruvate ferredoxin oxidoreductase n=1 Tax=Segatella cerevisiae TaxID=2053716 RepID=A0ABT1BWW9_9BACT|nr:pyruvate ferredoxin oxidoreductase [Segatella cerevisiae]MCH3994662.1 pyruvate ferredoxin oxidoreductase [Prevotella sp.]MCI1246497.1 pyruvate ferredoxin oxidoreductase [Prevotella sp.]MCO6025581.1 pyruvate ferredoxin oxidoreductase [Segatella cerevisiae]